MLGVFSSNKATINITSIVTTSLIGKYRDTALDIYILVSNRAIQDALDNRRSLEGVAHYTYQHRDAIVEIITTAIATYIIRGKGSKLEESLKGVVRLINIDHDCDFVYRHVKFDIYVYNLQQD